MNMGRYGKGTVNMVGIWLVSFVFLCGLVSSGLVGVGLEMWGKRRLAFGDPFVTREHVWRSLWMTALSGPFMLVNEALAALKEKRIGVPSMISCVGLSLTWVFLTGIVVLDVAFFLSNLLS